MLRAAELTKIVDKAEVSLALCDTRALDELVACAKDSQFLNKVIGFDGTANHDAELDRAALSKPVRFDAVRTGRDDVALLGFTSGTTGEPKATMHFHRDLLIIADGYAREVLKVVPDDIFVGSPPLAFTFGLGGLVLFPLHVGAATILLERAGPDDLLAAAAQFGATVCFTAPTAYRAMLAKLAEHDISSLRKCVSGYEARVVDTEGNEVAPNTLGRLAVRGPTGCRYLADNRQRVYVRNGWNITGDTYLMDADGYFWYQARSDDMIVSAGYNIAGPEVETALLTHPAVAECGVVGAPDAERGQIVKAYVVLRPGHAGDPALTKLLQDYVKANIAPYKYPRAIEYVAVLPRTQTGKLQRFELRRMAGEPASHQLAS
jgi:2-aminobenzoate-CoA ligase